VVVPPRDAALFSDAAFVFAETNQDAARSLLARTEPDGGGDSFYDLAPDGGTRVRGWMDVTGSRIDPAAFTATTGGIEGGADVDLGGGFRLGGALAYDSSHLTDADHGSADQTEVRGGVYASQTVAGVGFSASLSYAHGSESFDRRTGFGVATSSRGVDDLVGAVPAAAPFQLSGSQVTPEVGLLISDVSAGAFAETDGKNSAFALTGASAHGVAISPYATVALSHAFTTQGGVVIRPDVEVGYRYDEVATGLSQTLVAADGTVFPGNRAGLQRSSALLGAGFTAHQGRWTGFVNYRASVAGDWNNQAFSAGLRFAF
jgi:hypothetical protein